ncbi:MAG TPA: creatininase family protein [Gemmatimonadaceae bacterium]
MRTGLVLSALALAVSTAAAQNPTQAGAAGRGRGRGPAPNSMGGGSCGVLKPDTAAGQYRGNPWNCKDTPNPIATPNTIWFEEMTWMDVRDALKKGTTTIIIPTGGLEPNGPWLVTGKHNYVLTANCEAIARKMGNALCAPVVKFVPEGQIDPPTSHMASPNTISMREETFRMLLTDIVHSLKMHGFKQIFLIGDSGGNQPGQRAVADSLNKLWNADPLVAHIQEYYDYAGAARFMEDKGIKEDSTKAENLHDDPIITLNMYIADPKSVRYDERVKAGKASINGISIADKNKNLALAKQIVEFRATTTVDAIKKAIANKGTLPAPQRGRGRGTP